MSYPTDWASLHGTFFNGTRICITGGAGFIGSHLVEALTGLGARCVVIDDLSGGSRENISAFDPAFIEASILDLDAVAEAISGCRFVFHQAAMGSVPRSVEQPRKYNDINVTGTLNVLEAARIAGVQRVMFAASSSAYGNTQVLPKMETMPPLPASPYAANKVADEAMMRAWATSYGLDTVSLRYFNIFGPRQNANSAYAAVIAAFAKDLIAGEKPTIFGDGTQSRDFTFVDNAVHANLLAARNEKPLRGEVFNVACGQRITVNELAEKMAAMLDRPDLTPQYVGIRAGDVKHSLADLSLVRSTLGYTPIIPFAEGLKPTVEWYQRVLAEAGDASQEKR